MAPDTEVREFAFSETNIRKAKWVVVALLFFGAFSGGVFAWYFSDVRIGTGLAAIGKVLLVLGPVVAIEVLALNRRSRKMKVLTYDDKIVKQCGKKQHILLWNDISEMRRVYNTSGVTAQIILYPKKPKTSMYLGGFRDMDDLANLIRERTPGEVMLQEKRWTLDWQNPLVVVLVVGVPTVFTIFVLASIGSKALVICAILVVLGAGLIFLVYRPLTKWDIGLKWIDLIAGIGMLILGIHMLRCLLTLGTIP